MSLNPNMTVGVLDRMIKQLSETFDAFMQDRHPDISATTYARVCSDMTMQLEALKMARVASAKMFGDPSAESGQGVAVKLPDNG